MTDDYTPFDIVIRNATSGARTTLYVLPANTLGQVFEAVAKMVGLNNKREDMYIYINESTNQDAYDLTLALKDFQIVENTCITFAQIAKETA